MAARLNNRHQQMVRDKIQVSQLINRLEKHVDGEVELKATQVDAAKYLISQAIGAPAANTMISGDPDNPLEIKEIVLRAVGAVDNRPASEGG